LVTFLRITKVVIIEIETNANKKIIIFILLSPDFGFAYLLETTLLLGAILLLETTVLLEVTLLLEAALLLEVTLLLLEAALLLEATLLLEAALLLLEEDVVTQTTGFVMISLINVTAPFVLATVLLPSHQHSM
jgi:hypothetical protein